jgi:hypothetical protein
MKSLLRLGFDVATNERRPIMVVSLRMVLVLRMPHQGALSCLLSARPLQFLNPKTE